MPEDDILVYSDAGSSFNFKAKEKFFSYIDLLNQSSSGNLRFKMKYIENQWTTKQLLNILTIDRTQPLEAQVNFMRHI